ncbi:putative GNAT family N-acetyltransferase [Kineococcus arenarius]|uniref:hypothetical protein n=1 Tax=Kineococcus sp. SYSU DK007 TaxID=3383128 RepID=UPI003D7DE0B9
MRPFRCLAAVHREPGGLITALLAHVSDRAHRNGDPDAAMAVVDHLVVHLHAAAALWRYAFDIDRLRHIVIENTAPDDPLPLWLVDPRAAEFVGAGNGPRRSRSPPPRCSRKRHRRPTTMPRGRFVVGAVLSPSQPTAPAPGPRS